MVPGSRRSFLLAALLSPTAGPRAELRPDEAAAVRIGLTPVFLDDQAAFLNVWREYLQQRLRTSVSFVRRGSYRQIVDLLQTASLDFAWVCGYPYVRHRQDLRLLAVPMYRGRPLYQSYLIVPRGDTVTRSILELRGKVFAYSDPDSNSGFVYPQHWLRQLRETPDTFFSRAFFTWSHRGVVEAVAVGLADGGAVDGYVWDTLSRLHPDLTAQTRVAHRSPEFGFPPFVARASLAANAFASMQSILTGMSDDPAGTSLLRRLNLDGFVAGDPRLFDGVKAMLPPTPAASDVR
jgi:phosphonate transport system substrate-binding protein